MAIPSTLNLDYYSGDDDDLTLVLKNDGVLVDITGETAILQARTSTASETTVLDIAAVIDGPNGEIKFYITKAASASLTPTNASQSRYVYDVQLTYASGIIETLVKGSITGHPDVTRVI